MHEHKDATKKFNYTTIVDRVWMVSFSDFYVMVNLVQPTQLSHSLHYVFKNLNLIE